jgi:hypothetical protein
MPQTLVAAANHLEYSRMSNFIKTFSQYLFGEDRDEEDKEKFRHAKAKRQEQDIHQRVLAVGGPEGEEAEKARHRSAKRGEHQRHVADRRSKYKKLGHHTTSGE